MGELLAAGGFNGDALRHFNEHVAPGMALRTSLTRVEAPALVITGGLDPFGEPGARELAAALLPDATVVVVPEAGHSSSARSRRRPAWIGAVRDFLAGDPAP